MILKWLKRLSVIAVIAFALYLNHLDNLVNAEFSKPLNQSDASLLLESHPKALINMLLLIEDQSFFTHSGIDFKEIAIVLGDTLFFNKPIRGASTLTQQLIKNTLLTKEKTLKRKINEALMALLLEVSFEKNFILTRYMNTVYLGQQGSRAIYGFEQGVRNFISINHLIY